MEIASIVTALGMATSAVGLTGQAAATAQTIKKLFSSDAAPDNAEAAQLLNTLAADLTAANMMNVQISEALKVLSQELLRENEFEAEKARYELFQTSEGDIVFQLKTVSANGQPHHFICPVCVNRDKLISFVTGDEYFKRCQTNNQHTFNFMPTPDLSMEYHNDRWV